MSFKRETAGDEEVNNMRNKVRCHHRKGGFRDVLEAVDLS